MYSIELKAQKAVDPFQSELRAEQFQSSGRIRSNAMFIRGTEVKLARCYLVDKTKIRQHLIQFKTGKDI